jgi:multicomponent Na+:H+ antiporter subunit E
MLQLSRNEVRTMPHSWRGFAHNAVLLAAVWLGLNGRDHASWLIGLPAVLAAAAMATRLQLTPRTQLRWQGLIAFFVYFLRQSVLGGWDVARRVLAPRLDICPGHVAYNSALPTGPARYLFLSVISLLPGTLSADDDGENVKVHVLDESSDWRAELGELELRVAGVFSETGGVRS